MTRNIEKLHINGIEYTAPNGFLSSDFDMIDQHQKVIKLENKRPEEIQALHNEKLQKRAQAEKDIVNTTINAALAEKGLEPISKPK